MAFTVEPPTQYSRLGEDVKAACRTILAPTSGS